jgi:hypothetical protein
MRNESCSSERLFFTFQQNKVGQYPVTEDESSSRLHIRPFHTLGFRWAAGWFGFFECEDRFEDLLSLTRWKCSDLLEKVASAHRLRIV